MPLVDAVFENIDNPEFSESPEWMTCDREVEISSSPQPHRHLARHGSNVRQADLTRSLASTPG